MYIIKHAQEFSYNFVQNWFVNQDLLTMTLFQGETDTFQNMIVTILKLPYRLAFSLFEHRIWPNIFIISQKNKEDRLKGKNSSLFP